MNKDKHLTYKEEDFIRDVIAKELYFGIYSAEETELMRIVRQHVQEEKDKIDEGIFAEENQEKDSRIAASILKKLHVIEEEEE